MIIYKIFNLQRVNFRIYIAHKKNGNFRILLKQTLFYLVKTKAVASKFV